MSDARQSHPSHVADAPTAEIGPNDSKTDRQQLEIVAPDASSAAPVTVCSSCGAVIPEGRGHCLGCGKFTPFNVDALTLGLRSKKLAKVVDAYRIDLIEQLFRERGGREALDVVSRIAIENYALVCAQHKSIEARLDQDGLFTKTGRRRSAFDMLKNISETIDRLRAELPPLIKRPTTTSKELATEPDEKLIERLEALLTYARETRDLRLHVERIAAEEKALGNKPIAATSDSADTAPPASLPQPTPVPTCGYGCGSLERCAEIKATRLEAWRALHYNDPSEIERRKKEATAEMFARVGKPHPWLND